MSPTLVTVASVSSYIAIEGVDGSGKSTVAAALAGRFEAMGETVVCVREPGGTPVGEAVRGLLLDSDSLDTWAEVFLFAAQRAELVKTVVKPALERGEWVISDRTYYSSIAYQGRARGVGEERVRAFNEAGLEGIVPDHVFVLDVDPSVALERQSAPDRIGRLGVDFQSEVAAGYRELAKAEEKVVLVDGSLAVDDQVDLILARLSL